MEKLTYDEIIKKLDDLEITPQVLYNEDMTEDQGAGLDALGAYEQVYREGGGEGGGEYCERVFLFKEHDVYIQITGGYYSNHGTDWDDEYHEVFPRRVINTVYETAAMRGDKKDEA